jgi:hypothetical protein
LLLQSAQAWLEITAFTAAAPGNSDCAEGNAVRLLLQSITAATCLWPVALLSGQNTELPESGILYSYDHDGQVVAVKMPRAASQDEFQAVKLSPQTMKFVARDSPIAPEVLRRLANQCAIRVLDLHGSKLSGEHLREVSAMTELEQLVLSDCDIDDDDIRSLGTLPHLVSLDLTGTRISNVSLPEVARLKNLRSLSLARTAVVSSRSARAADLPTLDSLGSLQQLESIDLSRLPLGDDDIEQLCPCTRLRSIVVHNETDRLSPDSLRKLRESAPQLIIGPHICRYWHVAFASNPKGELYKIAAIATSNWTLIPEAERQHVQELTQGQRALWASWASAVS